MVRILLLNMPFVSLSRPAIGISIIKARLLEEGVCSRVGYGNLLFAERVGVDAYKLINDRLSGWMFAGDWLFSEYLFPKRDRSPYLAILREKLNDDREFEKLLALRAEVYPFLEACFNEFDIASHDVIGFTTSFEQNLASLALSHSIKSRYPDKVIVLGGANCEGVMGLELHRQFPWINYVCSGESDNSFPALINRISTGRSPEGLPGVIYRQAGESKLSAAPDHVRDMDSLPDPDYDDYFAAVGRSSIGCQLEPALLIETARGCWWGAKSHCTFCGLNGSTLTFRAKSGSRVYAELTRQKARYGVQQFVAVDNIMSHGFFRDLLPMLKEHNPGISLFYEIKSNLRRHQIELLRDAGVTAIQPGIESLNTHVLQMMRKGVTGIQNVQLLKLVREYGMGIAWNLLYGFPGEEPEDYEKTARVIEAIVHLPAPTTTAKIRLDRFSPNYDRADVLGFVNVRPLAIYKHIYFLPDDSVTNLAYFFDYEYADGRKPIDYVHPALKKVKTWTENQDGDLVKRYGTDPELMVLDNRPGRQPLNYPFNGIQREIYDFCDEIRTRSSIEKFAAEHAGQAVSVDAFLEQLVGFQLMLQEGNQYLSLAIDPRRGHAQPGLAEALAF